MVETTLVIAFIAGILSFLSPCVLPLVPAFVGYLSGVSVNELKQGTSSRLSILINTLFFVLGFSVIFAVLGVLLNSILSTVSYDIRTWLSRIGGIVIILFGMYLLGVFKLSFLDREYKFRTKRYKSSYLTSFIFGATFAVGWTPCVGAVLGAILTLAVAVPEKAFVLLLSYALGLGMPFIIVGLFTSWIMGIIGRYNWLLKYFNIIAGMMLIILGILVFTNSLGLIANLSIVQNFIDRFYLQ
jgi:cytochrome c-type biogenesis protein